MSSGPGEAVDGLHPAITHHIVNSLGWSSLRPLQEAAIAPILRGDHALLLAPTAGGKTEAALFPVLSRMLSEGWTGLSVIYLCPIKALLNNLESRLGFYAGLMGRRAELWHGDVSAPRKARLAADPPDLLLTTPESLEVMLVSGRIDHRRLFGGLRCAIVDEVHAFAGDDRGWHLLYLLQRLSRIAGVELQRLGLSATVGNPEQLGNWLAATCARPRVVLNPAVDGHIRPQVVLDWVGNLANAALVISRLHRGEKRLVFCDSRACVEELALGLRARGVNTFVSHSSLSRDERHGAEAAFAEGSDCVIVATSTLELGIDVGDLDRVIQIDAPGSVASFLQRVGRTGRRPGTARNCLFLVTREEAFLPTAALLQLWSEDYVEPVLPPPLPMHIFAQQIMALTLQEGGIAAGDWRDWLGSLPEFSGIDQARAGRVLDFMVESQILHSDQGVLGIGRSGEAHYGHRHFLALYSVFLSQPLVKVFHGRRELGEVHQSTFILKEEGPCVLTLAGRAWQTKHLDWARRLAFVEPTELRGRSQWMSGGQPLSFALCQAMTRLLAGRAAPVQLSQRAQGHLDGLRDEFDWVEPGRTFLIGHSGGAVLWWTFAGKLINAALAGALAGEAGKVSAGDLSIRFDGGVNLDALKLAIRRIAAGDTTKLAIPLDESFVAELKFGECLPQGCIDEELSARYDFTKDLRLLLGYAL